MRFLFLTAAIFYHLTALAIDLTPDQTKMAHDVFANTMSPYCPGKLLSDCPSSAASELKDKIRVKISEGASHSEIETYLEEVFGSGIHAVPPTSGFGLVAWITPALFLFLGFVIYFFWLRKTSGEMIINTKPSVPLKTEWEDEIDEELKR